MVNKSNKLVGSCNDSIIFQIAEAGIVVVLFFFFLQGMLLKDYSNWPFKIKTPSPKYSSRHISLAVSSCEESAEGQNFCKSFVGLNTQL